MEFGAFILLILPSILLQKGVLVCNDSFDMYNNFLSSKLQGDTLVSGSAHLGGAAMAAITWARVRRGRF